MLGAVSAHATQISLSLVPLATVDPSGAVMLAELAEEVSCAHVEWTTVDGELRWHAAHAPRPTW